MEEYFESNKNEKELIMEEIQKMSAHLNKYGVKMDQEIPDYLLPAVVKERIKMDKGEEEKGGYKKFKKILVKSANPDFE